MKITVKDTPFGEITFEGDFFLDEKQMSINGVKLNLVNRKKDFVYRRGEDVIVFHVSQHFTKGLIASYNGGEIVLLKPADWYAHALSWLGCCAVILCSALEILPILGGVLGGMICAAFALAASELSRRLSSVLAKILITLGASLAAFAVCTLIGFALVS